MRILKVVFALSAALACVLVATPAAADFRDIDVQNLPFGDCGVTGFIGSVAPAPGPGNDGAIPAICRVRFTGAGFEAATGTWILFQRRFDVLSSSDACQALAAATTFAMTINGSTVVAGIECKQVTSGPFAGSWQISVEYLSHPLAPGEYIATVSLTTPSGSASGIATLTITAAQ